MQLFADLLDALSYQPARNGKLRLIEDYLRHAPDPDRGYALAALCGELELPSLKPAALRDMTMARVDPELFGWSYDYVGDLAETIALIWPVADGATHVPPRLSDVVERLRLSGRAEAMMLMSGWLDGLDATGRWALLKLAAGALRVGVSARLAKTALAGIGAVSLEEIEELWPQHEPPYTALISWVTGGDKPAARNTLGFRPLMLSHPIDEAGLRQSRAARFLRRVEVGWHPRAGRGRRRPDAALFARRRRHQRRLPRPHRARRFRSSAGRRAAGGQADRRRDRGRVVQRPAAAPQSQEAEPGVAGVQSRACPALRCAHHRQRGRAPAALARAAPASGSLVRREITATLRPFAADPVRRLERACAASAPMRAPAASKA